MTTTTQPFRGTYTADPDHSTFQAGVRHMGVSRFRPSFEDVEARLIADDSGLRLEGAARVESISIKNPPEFREHVVNGADFFDATNHPELRFRSQRIDLHDDGTLELEGELEIKNISRALKATGTYVAPTPDPYGAVRTAIELTARVDRREFGLNWQAPLPKGGDVLAWDVDISVHLELVQPGA